MQSIIVCVVFLTLSNSCLGRMVLQLKPNVTMEEYFERIPEIVPLVEKKFSFAMFQSIAGPFEPLEFEIWRRSGDMVEALEPDYDMRASAVQTGAPPHLARLSSRFPLGAMAAPYQFYYNDSFVDYNVDAYILDTGVQPDHPDLHSRLVMQRDFSGEGIGDFNGHGTHVCGIIGSEAYGVAKAVNFIDLKVLNKNGGGSLSNVLDGLTFAAIRRMRIGRRAVANLSLGGAYNTILNYAIQQAVESGLPVIVAAGNANLPACATSPAGSPFAITVGAIDPFTDNIAFFSNWGQCVNVYATGIGVQSVPYAGETAPVILTGTSMASPIVTGLLAYFMAHGDDEVEAVKRMNNIATRHSIPLSSIMTRPFSSSRIVYNNADDLM